ncbi:efflux RND transporter periplasmic adaptor subunit [Desulfomicrobium salsuginis]
MNTARKRRPWRTLFITLFCLALAAALAAGLWPKPMPVQTTAVARGPMAVTVTEEGKTRIRSRYVVFPPMAGFLQRVALRAGAPIEAGKTVLAVLTPEPSTFLTPRTRAEAQARLQAAEAAVQARRAERERVRTSLGLARTDLSRLDALLADGAVARQDWDRAENQVRVLERELQTASFALQVAVHEAEAARATLSRGDVSGRTEAVTILAPVDGYVLAVMEENARAVAPSTPIMEVGDPRDLEIEIELLSTDAVAVAPGAEALIEHWGGEGVLRARVTTVEPGGFTKVSAIGVEEQRVKVRAELTGALPDGVMLGDRYGVQARIVTWRGEDVPQVPTSALFRRGGEWMAFVLEGGKAAVRTVGIGRENGLYAEVRDGLKEGERVILHPPDTLADGMRVREEGL